MQSKATTVSEYLASLEPERRAAVEAIRTTILKNLPKGYEEGMQYGMIGYYVPHSVYPPGYHCDPRQPLPFAGIGSQKNHIGIYLMCNYGVPEHESQFRREWIAAGKKLDMGKACVRVKKLDDVPLKVLGDAIKRVPVKKYLDHYESVIKTAGKRPAKSAASKPASKKKSAANSAAKKKVTASAKKAPAASRKSTANATATKRKLK